MSPTVCFVVTLLSSIAFAAEPRTGLPLSPSPDGKAVSLRYPKGRHKQGYSFRHDGTRDWRDYRGLEIAVDAEAGRKVEMTVVLFAPPGISDDGRTPARIAATGARMARLPWAAFDHLRARTSFLKFVQGVEPGTRYTDGKPGVPKVGKLAPPSPPPRHEEILPAAAWFMTTCR